MKKIILMMALVFGAAAFGQETEKKMTVKSSERMSTEVKSENSPNAIVKALDLNKEQQKKLEQLLAKGEKTARDEEAIKSDYRIEDDEALEKEFRAILTPEQNKKLDELKKEYEMKRQEEAQQELQKDDSKKSKVEPIRQIKSAN